MENQYKAHAASTLCTMGVHIRAAAAIMVMSTAVIGTLLGGCAGTPAEIEPNTPGGGLSADRGGSQSDGGTGLSLFVIDQADAAKQLGELTPARLAMKVMGSRWAFDGKKPESRLVSTRVVLEGEKRLSVREVPFEGSEPSEGIRTPKPIAEGGKGSELPKKGTQLEMAIDDQGRLVLSRSADFEDRVTTSFSPAMIVLPKVLEMGRPVVSEFEMVVRPMDNPSAIKAQGKAKNTAELVRFERVRTKEGEFIAARVRSKLEAELNPAKVVNTTTSWFVPELGVIAEQEIQRVTALGLPVRSSDAVWITSPVKSRKGDREKK